VDGERFQDDNRTGIRTGMSMQWFRMYSEFAGDPVIQSLAFEDQRHYVVLLCIKSDGTLDKTLATQIRERVICRALGLDPLAASEAKRRLIEVGLITKDWQPVGWDKRQFVSDNSTERVRKYRKSKETGNVTETIPERSGNGPDTDTDTDTDTDNTTYGGSDARTRPTDGKKPESRSCKLRSDQPLAPDQFAAAWACYPKRQGDNPKAKAVRAWNARIRDGTDPAAMLAGVERYCAFCQETHKVGTETVKQAATFFGPDRAFDESWNVTPPTRSNGNASKNRDINWYSTDF
jgi:hypothetical protein